LVEEAWYWAAEWNRANKMKGKCKKRERRVAVFAFKARRQLQKKHQKPLKKKNSFHTKWGKRGNLII